MPGTLISATPLSNEFKSSPPEPPSAPFAGVIAAGRVGVGECVVVGKRVGVGEGVDVGR